MGNDSDVKKLFSWFKLMPKEKGELVGVRRYLSSDGSALSFEPPTAD
jgi:hypothetical protein